MTVSPESFVQGMRQLAASVTVITTVQDGRRAGMTATAVCSVSTRPPQLLVCLNRCTETHDAVAASGVFAVNLLASHQRHLAEIFAGNGDVFGDHRFETAMWSSLETGAPVLQPCLAGFDCRVVEVAEAATHAIFIGRVVAISIEAALQPLVYVEGGYGQIAGQSSAAS